MKEYWESRFKEEGAMWAFEPSDSAVKACTLFQSHSVRHVLIPGVGYGRNAKVFYDKGFQLTGIEISKSAIALAKENGLDFKIYHGSVTSMPFDEELYDGIFCYAMLHLLTKPQRRKFLQSCYDQLKPGGIMVFSVVSREAAMYGKGKLVSKDRFEVMKGVTVYFYDEDSIKKEFSDFGLVSFEDINEPIKHMTGQEPLKLKFVVCKKP